MVPVQYRDVQTDEILDSRYEMEAPAIGQTVMFDDVWECEVLYRWQSGPTCRIVYVRPVRSRERTGAYALA